MDPYQEEKIAKFRLDPRAREMAIGTVKEVRAHSPEEVLEAIRWLKALSGAYAAAGYDSGAGVLTSACACLIAVYYGIAEVKE